MFKGKASHSISMFRRHKSQSQSNQEKPTGEKSGQQHLSNQQPQQQSQSQSQPHRRNSKESTKSKASSGSGQSGTLSETPKGDATNTLRQYNVELLHAGDKKNPSHVHQTYTHESSDSDECLSPLTSGGANGQGDGDTHSIALSETDTLCATRKQRLELQDTYTDNFSMYLPFVLRQLRLAESREQAEDRRRREARASAGRGGRSDGSNALPVDHFDEDYDAENDTVADDDLSTIFNDSQSPEEQFDIDHRKIMDRNLSAYNHKRLVVFVGCTLKSDVLIFPTSESFKLFKQLRANIKKERKSSVIVYDAQGNIKKVTPSNGANKNEYTNNGNNDEVIDDRNHIVPVSYKIKGQGLPALRMILPYMSTFRKNTPYLIFKKFKEVPSAPKPSDQKQNDIDFETFDYCYVYLKYSLNYRRFIFEFYPNSPSCFKLVMFESTFKPFADFNYKQTRFRVIGTTISTGLVCEYNPHMRLLIIDDDEPSLCDGIINKKPSSGFMKLKKKPLSLEKEEYIEFDINKPSTYINPIPNSKFVDEDGFSNCCHHRATFIPNNLPPFGCYKDASLYKVDHASFIPRKHFEIGKGEIYQNLQSVAAAAAATTTTTTISSSSTTTTTTTPSAIATATASPISPQCIAANEQSTTEEFLNSTLSMDQDTLVLSVVLSTLREVNVKNANKSSGSPMMRAGGGVLRNAHFGLMTTGMSSF